MEALRKRLVIPVQLREPREKLLLVTPWFLRERDLDPASDKESAPSSILTFTDDDFIPAVFDGVEQSGTGRNEDAFEKLVRYRDYAEPPGGMLDATGEPLYPTTGDKAIRRLAPPPLEPVVFDESRNESDGVPYDEPPWLRKLYLPLHRHFHVVVTEVVCKRFDFPRLAKERVLEAGMIVRRLVRDRSDQRWEDWISISEEEGAWVEIADRDMKRDMKPVIAAAAEGSDLPLDPTALPPGVFGNTNGQTQLMARLGITDEKALPTALATDELSLIPAAVGEAASHTALFGYLPLASAARILPEPEPADIENLKTALADRARAHLDAELLGQRPGATITPAQAVKNMRGNIQKPIRELLNKLIKPELAPSIGTGGDGAGAGSTSDDSSSEDPLAPKAREILLKAMWNCSDSSDEATTWFNLVTSDAVDIARGRSLIGTDSTPFEALMKAELGAMVNRYLENGSSADSLQDYIELRQLMATLLRRLRRCRISLAKDIYRNIFNIFEGEAVDPDPDEDRDGVPVTTVGSLADELTAWIEGEAPEQRKLQPRPWPPLDLGTTERAFWVKVHQAGAELEAVLREIDERGAGAGLAYGEVLDARAETVVRELANSLGTASVALRGVGFDLAAQPERGIFVHPTFAPGVVDATTTVELFIDEVARQYTQKRPDETGDERLEARVRAEAKSIADTTRPRFDSESLYTVMAYVRVAGRDPCEKGQVVWSAPSDVFSLAEPADVLGARPVAFQLPDLKKLVRDIPRIAKAQAAPFAAVTTPPDSGFEVGELPTDTSRTFGIEMICSFGIPVFTICAWVLFSIVFSILSKIPGFMWMMMLKFCVPSRR